MKRFLFCLLALTFFARTQACLNEYHVSKTGVETVDHFAMGNLHFIRDFNITELNESLKILLKDTSSGKDDILYNRNNIAVIYIKLGKLIEAKNLLEELVKSYPHEYNVNVNLGTLYELMGENSKAFTYIKKAMTINTDSHRGSEWFHVRVLEYKLRNRNDKQTSDDNILELNKSTFTAEDLAEAIAYQLKERIPFTPTPNLMMAKILMEYGDYLADSISVEGAYVIYDIAKEYDSAKVLPLEGRKDVLLPIFKKFKRKIPNYKRYFLTSKETIENESEEMSNLLEDGLTKEASSGSATKMYLVVGGLILLGLFIFFFIRFRR